MIGNHIPFPPSVITFVMNVCEAHHPGHGALVGGNWTSCQDPSMRQVETLMVRLSKPSALVPDNLSS